MLFADIDGRRIEYRLIPGDAGRVPLVFLHEGLGCVALWRDFPDRVARALGHPALVYSRFGYGGSDGLTRPRTPRFMHEEALDILPRLLDLLGLERPLLIGHSDGASIALIHAAAAEREVAGLVLMAPHVFVEAISVASIAKVHAGYATSGLRERLAKYHTRVDDAFLGWADTWLLSAFRDWSLVPLCREIDAPVLLIQGRDDEYGTFAQLDAIAAGVQGPVTRLELDECGHAPQRDQPDAVAEAIQRFAREIRGGGR